MVLGRYLYTEWEDPGFGPRAATVHQQFTQTASEVLKEAISNQMQVIAQLKHINTDIKVPSCRPASPRFHPWPVKPTSCPAFSNLEAVSRSFAGADIEKRQGPDMSALLRQCSKIHHISHKLGPCMSFVLIPILAVKVQAQMIHQGQECD